MAMLFSLSTMNHVFDSNDFLLYTISYALPLFQLLSFPDLKGIQLSPLTKLQKSNILPHP